MEQISRRYFFLGCLAAAAAGYRKQSRRPASDGAQVSIVRAGSYSVDLLDAVRRILVEHRVPVKDKRIVLKPNLVEFNPDVPINTNPLFVASVAEAFRSLGARTVRIAEGPGHRRMTLDMAEAAGYFNSVPRFEDSFVDLNLDEVSRVVLPNAVSTLKELYLPHTVRDCDLLVSLPKMKTHHWVGATLSMKNLFGVVPGSVYGWPKNVLHWAGINECIVDLHELFPKQFAIVDGIEGMEGNGPILGSPKHAGVIVAGSHPPSVDATCCRIMQIDPEKVGYLSLSAKRPGVDFRQARQTGETIASVTTPFSLIPDFASLRLTTVRA